MPSALRRAIRATIACELNQVILNLICENQAGIPVYMKPASGNSNDMKGFKKIVKSHIHSPKAARASRYLVADAALYVKETLEALHKLAQLFITRVPQTLTQAKDLIKQAPTLTFEAMENGYSVMGKFRIWGRPSALANGAQ